MIDPLTPLELGEFWSLLVGREVVALAARQELLFCLRYTKRLPAKLFDPQIAAGLLGYGYPLSHTNLVRQVLGVRAAPSEAYTDWRRRPLSDKQLEYGAGDVRELLAARDRLLQKARTKDRVDWIETECARFAERIELEEGEERWWRFPGSNRLRRRELAILRELWRWRDGVAREADQPPRRVLRDDLVIEIVKRAPQTMEDLFSLRGLERGSVRKAGPGILAAVQAGLAVPDSDLPKLERRDDPPQVAVLGHLASVLANGLAAEYDVDPALLATTADLQDLVRWHLVGGRDVRPLVLQGWRDEILGEPLLDMLRGRSAVRVVDVHARNPFRIVHEE